MKKISTIASVITTAALTFALVSNASAASTAARAKPKTGASVSAGTSSAAKAGQGANAMNRGGIAGVGASSSTDATASGLLNGSGSVGSDSEFGASCNLGDGSTLLSKALKAKFGRAFTMRIAGGQGCLSSLPDAGTASTAVELADAGSAATNRLGLANFTAGNPAQRLEIVEGVVLAMQNQLGIDRASSVDRIKGVCASCDVFSQDFCTAAQALNN
jgi:hypothetical protein